MDFKKVIILKKFNFVNYFFKNTIKLFNIIKFQKNTYINN